MAAGLITIKEGLVVIYMPYLVPFTTALDRHGMLISILCNAKCNAEIPTAQHPSSCYLCLNKEKIRSGINITRKACSRSCERWRSLRLRMSRTELRPCGGTSCSYSRCTLYNRSDLVKQLIVIRRCGMSRNLDENRKR